MTTNTLPKSSPIYSNIVSDYLVNELFQVADPDITLKNLGVSRKALRELETDNDIYACIETRRQSLLSTPWRLEKCNSKNEKFIFSEIEKVIEPILTNGFNAVLYGYSVTEVIYEKRGDGRIGVKQAYEVPIEHFEPKRDGDLVYRSVINPAGEIVDKQFKFLLSIRNNSFLNPYGEALLSRLYFPYIFRKNSWRFWVKALERCATPFLVGHSPDMILPDGTPAVDYLSGVLNQAVSNSTMALPEGWEAEFLSAPQTGQSFNLFEDALLARIQRAILGQTLTSQVGGGGSYAAAKVHESVLDTKTLADIRLVGPAVQTLVNAIHTLNGFTGDPPRFVLETGTGLEVDRAGRDSQLVQAGILKLTPDYLLRVYDYENGDFEVPKPLATPKLTPANFSASTTPKFTADQQWIEELADNVLEKIVSPISNDAIYSAIKAARDYDDLADRLAVLFSDTDTKEFRTVLERATFTADCMGFAVASNNIQLATFGEDV